jgi:hypothetical protein
MNCKALPSLEQSEASPTVKLKPSATASLCFTIKFAVAAE